jgi:hypothetical protein
MLIVNTLDCDTCMKPEVQRMEFNKSKRGPEIYSKLCICISYLSINTHILDITSVSRVHSMLNLLENI